MHDQLAGLPDAAVQLAPILTSLDLPDETLADCARCVMLPKTESERAPWHFNRSTTCCTYHPDMANYLVGRALARRGPGLVRIRRRLLLPAGRTPLGLGPSDSLRTRYEREPHKTFGRDPSLVCPFRTSDRLSCSVWADRSAVCRTWFCKNSGGLNSAMLWRAVRDLLAHVELVLAQHCVATGTPPEDDAPPGAWELWYRYCADVVERLSASGTSALASERLAELTDKVREAASQRPEVPDVLIVSVRTMDSVDGGVRLTGYSAYDDVVVPPDMFAFFSRLDGERTWQDAARSAKEETGFELDPALFRRLVLCRILRAPTDHDDPETPSAPDMRALIDMP